MNMTETQAAGLKNLFAQLTPPLVEHDREVMRNRHIIETLRAIRPHMKAMGDALNGDLPDVPQMIVEGQRKAKLLGRMDELVEIAEFIGVSSPLERKHIINMLIDRGVEEEGLAPELEDAACSLSRSIEADVDAADSLRSYMERRDEL